MVWTPVLDSLSDSPEQPHQSISDLFAESNRPDFGRVAPTAAPVVAAPPAAVAQSATAVSVAPTVMPAAPTAAPSAAETSHVSYSSVAVIEKIPATEGMIVPAMPTLSPPSRAATPRAIQVDDTTVAEISARDGKRKAAAASAPRGSKKKQRHPFRTFVALLIVLAMLGGAAYAGWYFLLRKKVEWTEDVKPLATFVETTVGHEFSENVPIESLSAPEYEVKLGIETLANSYADADGTNATMRAVGLLTDNPAPSDAGRALSPYQPAFYRPSNGTIYRLEGDSAVFEAAMIKALTMALMDQELQWADEMASLNDSQRVGFRALLDGAAQRVLDARFVADPELKATYNATVTARDDVAGPLDTPIYAVPALNSYLTGAELGPLGRDDDILAGVTIPPSDAVILDPLRPFDQQPVVLASDGSDAIPRTLGVQFWESALSPVLGDGARAAALLWAGDRTVTTLPTPTGQPCMKARIATASAADQATLLADLTLWAQSRPASSAATVVAEESNVVQVAMCEPTEGNAVPTSVVAPMDMFAAVRVERAFLEEAHRTGLPDSANPRLCAMVAFRGGSVAGYEIGTVDPVVTGALTNVVNFCKNA